MRVLYNMFLHFYASEETAMPADFPVEGPFMRLKDAAAYCGYAPDTFDKLRRQFNIPKHGPKKNRFARSVLDKFMEEPEMFKAAAPPAGRRGYKPIMIDS